MTAKTPASILQEMCIRKGNPPRYDLIHDGCGTHEAIFKYKVHVDGITAVGSGRSKKEAKHDAARNILEKLKDNPEPVVEEMMNVEVMSPYKDKLTDNAIGGLQELCMTNEIPIPVYILIADEGPPHAKQFTMKCQVLKLEEISIARTKKQAKQLAANKMLNRLKKSLADVLLQNSTEKTDTGEKELNSELRTDIAVSKYKELGSIPAVSRGRIPIGQKISEYHLILKHLKGNILDKLKEGDHEVLQRLQNDPTDLLKCLLDELNVDLEYIPLECEEEGRHVTLLNMTTSPESTVFGAGQSHEEACSTAAESALQYLKIMNA